MLRIKVFTTDKVLTPVLIKQLPNAEWKDILYSHDNTLSVYRTTVSIKMGKKMTVYLVQYSNDPELFKVFYDWLWVDLDEDITLSNTITSPFPDRNITFGNLAEKKMALKMFEYLRNASEFKLIV